MGKMRTRFYFYWVKRLFSFGALFKFIFISVVLLLSMFGFSGHKCSEVGTSSYWFLIWGFAIIAYWTLFAGCHSTGVTQPIFSVPYHRKYVHWSGLLYGICYTATVISILILPRLINVGSILSPNCSHQDAFQIFVTVFFIFSMAIFIGSLFLAESFTLIFGPLIAVIIIIVLHANFWETFKKLEISEALNSPNWRLAIGSISIFLLFKSISLISSRSWLRYDNLTIIHKSGRSPFASFRELLKPIFKIPSRLALSIGSKKIIFSSQKTLTDPYRMLLTTLVLYLCAGVIFILVCALSFIVILIFVKIITLFVPETPIVQNSPTNTNGQKDISLSLVFSILFLWLICTIQCYPATNLLDRKQRARFRALSDLSFILMPIAIAETVSFMFHLHWPLTFENLIQALLNITKDAIFIVPFLCSQSFLSLIFLSIQKKIFDRWDGRDNRGGILIAALFIGIGYVIGREQIIPYFIYPTAILYLLCVFPLYRWIYRTNDLV
jgi:hypothetical protein